MAIAIKEKRIEIRVSAEAKKTIEGAARLSNISLSSYILSVALRQARIDLNAIVLNSEDREKVIESLNKPDEPNEALIDLFKSSK